MNEILNEERAKWAAEGRKSPGSLSDAREHGEQSARDLSRLQGDIRGFEHEREITNIQRKENLDAQLAYLPERIKELKAMWESSASLLQEISVLRDLLNEIEDPERRNEVRNGLMKDYLDLKKSMGKLQNAIAIFEKDWEK